ncbi:MAG: HIT family protein [Chloroflexi bacterium AL-W]|nr:HIT family protein [Chloroflexi bacterium AL-N1]NOK66006.1 HIT family protein [Chloroflexi bacterium AL-N10]NOK72887.1 HIT family protein [Chloroflexi bacterium AL-N5]NOK79784.1 HIT family protein [Chloroflexi bacterium AL-W]NOK88360.1 HIT family protein [Chloroflexi bacterium AL-N15]
MSSIFSRIVRGEIPAATVYEDDLTLAFMDINPVARGHTLVICKEEYPDLFTLPAEALVAVARTTQHVALAIRTSLSPDGLNIVQNNGASAGQVIFHYHVHLIPRWENDGGPVRMGRHHESTPTDLQAVADQIRQQIAR